ncbi:cupin domain-containing protein [Comamonas sp. GB3 AK4-5]|uniref:cupin domain-containing protein n=1 Tax=Comamonas sp. GB3 AK4-5 TaxID=3231487 RepID=UPI00351E360F
MPERTLRASVTALGVDWQQRPLRPEPGLAALLAQPALSEGDKATVVQALGAELVDVCLAHGYHSMDLVVLHPDTPGLDEALARFDLPHTHADDEVRYIVDGAGLFGFFDAEGREHSMRVGPGDYLRVPAGAEHRFTLTSARRIKALRLFSDTAGWVAQYTARVADPMEVLE